ncbi:hypothetical protein LCGC14_2581490 [marine sediment metagenome]|uniref:GIY-YIG domain-containing protein n=1 Tax=marine sediment metagenome TaxID=412755 RepID=A0A0F9D720_9ZZZZ
MKTGIIYIATDTTNNMQYVGQTITTLKKRKSGGYNPYFQNAINKHGNKIEWEIIGELLIEELDLLERCYIWGLSTIYPNGYNFESGGNKNKRISEETRRKLSESHMGEKHFMHGKCHSKETKQKMRVARAGKTNSEKTRRKISKANSGKTRTEETKKKMSKTKKNMSAEIKKKMSKAHKGLKAGVETKKKMSKSRKGEGNFNTKLAESQILEIRAKYATGNYTKVRLANEYGVNGTNIYYIVNCKSWRHI